MSQCTYRKTSALTQSPDVVLLKSVSIKQRAEYALSTDALVVDVIGKMLITFFIFGNITSTLLSYIYFNVLDKLFTSFFCTDAQYFIHKLIS